MAGLTWKTANETFEALAALCAQQTVIYLVQPLDGDVDDHGFFDVCRKHDLTARNVGWNLEGLGDLIEEANALGGYPEPWRGPVVFAELRLHAPAACI